MYNDFFFYKCKIPVRPKEFAVVMDAIPQKVLTLLKGASQEKDLNFKSNQITFIVTSPQHVCFGE